MNIFTANAVVIFCDNFPEHFIIKVALLNNFVFGAQRIISMAQAYRRSIQKW